VAPAAVAEAREQSLLGAQQAHERLLLRLAGSRPEHRSEFSRIGAGLLRENDPQLAALLPANPRHSAVLIGLVQGNDGPGVLLTVRAAHLRHHAGQIAFPGGVVEAADADLATAALREAQEEVGLAPEHARVIGYLPDHIVLTGFRITPVVADISASFEPRPDRSEVEQCFVLPLSTLLDCSSHRAARRHIAGIEVDVRDIHYGDHQIWGATAGMLFSLREMMVS
jgi:8-oxo-dGTP pyrophosphatase MutT (NUDIX family)